MENWKATNTKHLNIKLSFEHIYYIHRVCENDKSIYLIGELLGSF